MAYIMLVHSLSKLIVFTINKITVATINGRYDVKRRISTSAVLIILKDVHTKHMCNVGI